jgi:hypothetical protein
MNPHRDIGLDRLAGFAPDRLAPAQVGIDLFDEAVGDHRADHFCGHAMLG